MMIDAIIEYIREQGFIVDVIPTTLMIRKRVGEDIVHLSWMIDKTDLAYLPLEAHKHMADRKMDEIREAIRRGPPYEQ